MTCWWLSFCDPKRSEGDQFLGACLVEADDLPLAVEETRRLSINPGGEVLGADADPVTVRLIPSRWKNRLLTKAECAEMDEEVLALQERSGVPVPCEPDVQFICANHNKPEVVGKT